MVAEPNFEPIEEIWLGIAAHLHANDIAQLSLALEPIIKYPKFHQRLNWIRERTEGLYKHGCLYVLVLLREGSPKKFVKFVCKSLDKRQRRFLTRSLGMFEKEWAYLEFLINECHFPVKYLEVPLRARHLYGCSVDGLIQLINGRIEDKVITKLLSVTRKQCYLAVRERMNSWFDDSGNKLADGSTRAPYIMLHLPRKSDGTSHAIEEDSKNIIEYVETALKIAIQNNDVELAKFIIQMGVVNKQNFRMPPSEEMVALMLDYGLGTTLYDYTTIDYQLKSVQLLFAYGLVDMKAWLKWLCYDRNVAGVQQFVSNNGMEMLRWSELYEILYQHVWWCSRWKREQGLIIMEMILQSLSDRNDIIATANQLNSIRNEFGMTGCGSVLATMFTEYLKFSPITDDMSGAKFSLSPSSVEQFRWLHT